MPNSDMHEDTVEAICYPWIAFSSLRTTGPWCFISSRIFGFVVDLKQNIHQINLMNFKTYVTLCCLKPVSPG